MSREKQNELLINNPKSNNSEDMSNKHIEEMAKIACVGSREGDCENCKSVGICSSYTISEKLYNAGYRKQSENVIELPCKVGDRIYRLNRLFTDVTEATVKAIYFTEDKKYYPKPHIIIQYDLSRGRLRANFSEFGKTVFFSREEAEEAIAKMKGGE